MTDKRKLADAIFQMNRRGGYILAFSTRVAVENPELTWDEYHHLLTQNGTYCGYHPDVIRRNFEMGRAA